MRLAGSLLVMLAAAPAYAAPRALTADVTYHFSDQNGFGWVAAEGTVTVTLELAGKAPSLAIRGKRRTTDSQLVAGKTPNGPPDMKSTVWEGDVDVKFPLRNVTHAKRKTTFELDADHDKLTATCTPTTVAKLASKTLYECTITGFQWHSVANLPELHHPIVLDANVRAKTRISNSLMGGTNAGFGQRTVTEIKPRAAKP